MIFLQYSEVWKQWAVKEPPLVDIAKEWYFVAALCSSGCLFWSSIHTLLTCSNDEAMTKMSQVRQCSLKFPLKHLGVSQNEVSFVPLKETSLAPKTNTSFGDIHLKSFGNSSMFDACQVTCKPHVGSIDWHPELACTALILPNLTEYGHVFLCDLGPAKLSHYKIL